MRLERRLAVTSSNLPRQLRHALAMLTAFALAAAPSTAQRPATAPAGTDSDAAKLELLVLRTAISSHIPVRADSVTFAASAAPISADSAIRSLTRIAKPAVCVGIARRGMLNITCQAFAELEPSMISMDLEMRYTPTYGSITGGGGVLGFVHARSRAVFDTLDVLCIGRDTIVLPAPALERWERDYYATMDRDVPLYNMSGDDVHDDGRPSSLLRVAGQSHGVVAVYRFSSSADDHGTETVLTIRGAPERPSEDDRLARLANSLDDLTLGADEGMLRPALAKVAAMFTQHWAGRTLPPMVAMFVERYEAPHSTNR